MGRRPNPFAAALMSAIVPGVGQWYAGNGRRARKYLLITFALLLPAAFLFMMVFYVEGIGFAITLSRPFFEHPTLLGLLLAANAALLMFRAFAVVDAFLLARGPAPRHGRTPAVVVAVAMGFLLFLTAVPHGWIGHRNLLLYDLMTTDFNADPGQPDVDVTTTTPTGVDTTIPVTTSSTLSNAFPEEGRLNVLLMGGDSGEGRSGIRTDTMIVVSIDPQTGAAAMFSVSRNMMQTPLPPDQPYSNWWGETCPGCYPQALNLIYGDGGTRPDIWGGPNAGANAAKTTIGYMLGIDIHYYVLVDLNAFITIIDAIGGLDIFVRESVELGVLLDDGWYVESVIEPGWQHLDGTTALAYSRTRPDSDFERQNRQRCVLQALAAQTDPATAIREFPALVPVLQENLHTDIRMSDVPDFLELLGRFDPSGMVAIRIMPDAPEFAGTELSYMSGWTDDGYPIPNREFITERVALILDAQATAAAPGAGGSEPVDATELDGLPTITDVCGPTPEG